MGRVEPRLSEFHARLLAAARAAGFPLAGAIDLDLAYAAGADGIAPHIQKYREWIDAGHMGAMNYLVRGLDRRADPRLVFPDAQSMLCVAIPYPRRAAGREDPRQGPRYARYLQGGDYHKSLAERLEAMMEGIARAETEASISSAAPSESVRANAAHLLRWKVCVDTSAILERSWAALCGLGWIGKNTLLIHPKLGSYLFLAEVLINRTTGQGPAPMADLCGHCRRCLDGCPTSAFTAPRVLDSRSCASYQTLENRGPITLDEAARKRAGSWIAGCDICQEVCPFNQKPVREELLRTDRQRTALEELIPGDATRVAAWEALLLEDEASYRDRIRGSALSRVKPAQFRRNLAFALGETLRSLPKHERKRLGEKLLHIIANRLESEVDAHARLEWQRCLDNASEV